MCCSADNQQVKLPDSVASGARCLTGGVFEGDIEHRRSMAVLCMLYKISYNPFVPLRVTRGTLVTHRWTTNASATLNSMVWD